MSLAFQADFHHQMNVKLHNARREAEALQHALERARRALALSRAQLTEERSRSREAAAVLADLVAHAGRADVIASPRFLAMFATAAARVLGFSLS